MITRTSTADNQEDSNNNNNNDPITVGRLVEVQSRTWPGINKPGGVARVTNVHYDDDLALSHIDVQYILGNTKEKEVPVDYVRLAPEYEGGGGGGGRRQNNLRDRSMLLGRCRRCGSLRTDCGSCDWATEEETTANNTAIAKHTTTIRKAKRTTTVTPSHEYYSSSSSSSSSSSDEDVALRELLKQNQRKYRKYLRTKMKWEREYKRKPVKQKSKRKRKEYTGGAAVASVLESATSAPKMGMTLLISQPQDKEKTTNHLQHSDDNDTFDGPVVGSIEGDTSSSSSSSSSDESARSFTLPSLQVDTSSVYDYNTTTDTMGSQDATIALSQFIQPEGQEVAENLPQDIIDQTKDLRYHDLPKFFDDIATKTEDEWLPEWKFKVAKLIRSQRHQMQLIHGSISPQQLLQDCQEAFATMREQLIRGGIDQCRVALHKLMDRRLYQKNKNSLSVAQRKQCRGSGMMDARNLRMDALDEAVEDLVRKLRCVIRDCEEQVQEEKEANIDGDTSMDEEDDYNFGFYSDEESTSQEVFPRSTIGDMTIPLDPPPKDFHPHMHAQRVKNSKSQTVQVRGKKRRSTASAATSRKRSRDPFKRQRPVSDTFIVNKTAGASRQDRLQKNHTSEDVSRDKETMIAEDSTTNSRNNDILLNRKASHSRTLSARRIITGQKRASRKTKEGPNFEEDGTVPTFNLFESEFTNPTTENRRDHQIQSNRIPISRRMQSFLDANSGDAYDWEVQEEGIEDQEEAISKRRRRRKKAGQSRRTLQIVGRGGSSSNDKNRPNERHTNSVEDTSSSLEQEGDVDNDSFDNGMNENELPSDGGDEYVLAESLFSQLDETTRDEGPTLPLQQSACPTVPQSCDDLIALYPHSPYQCTLMLDRLNRRLSTESLVPEAENENVTFLKTCLNLLQEHGTMTLQELITTKSSLFVAHVKLLSVCLHTLRRIPNLTPISSGGALLEAVLTNRQSLVDILMLQMLDSLYSLLHSQAWALNIDNKAQILKSLCPLRDAIGQLTPLIETACRCLLESLACQKWRRGLTKNHAFVSCLDSTDWRDFVASGKMPAQPTTVRFYSLGKILPRVEVDTIWGLLAYLGQSKSIVAEQSNARWQILSKLFSLGVLAGEVTERTTTIPLPPSRSQLLACGKEISFMNALLSRGKLDGLPSSDSVLINLIRRSLTLQGDSYLSNPASTSELYPMATNHKSEKKFVARLWKASHPLFFASSHLEEPAMISDILFDDKEEQTLSAKYILAPSSNILKRCLELVSLWIKSLPDKKARCNRVIKALNGLRKALVDEATQCSTDGKSNETEKDKPDSFEAAFSAISSATESISKQSERMVFFREAAAWIKLVEHLSFVDLINKNTTYKVGSTLSIAEIWNIVADDNMKKRQKCIFENTVDCNCYNGDSLHLFTALKVMASTLLLQLKVCPWSLDTGSRMNKLGPLVASSTDTIIDKDTLHFAIACIISCLDCLCDVNQKGESPLTLHIYSILTLVFTNISKVVQLRDLYFTATQMEDTLPAMVFPSLLRCFKVHTRCSGGPQDSLHFRLLLCAVRAFASLQANVLNSNQQGAENGSTSNENDHVNNTVDEELWGSIDDDLLASIDLEGVASKESAPGEKTKVLKYMKDIIVRSKPSERFSLSRDNLQRNDFEMSVHGKHMVAKDVERVCECLASLVVIEKDVDFLPMLDILSPSIKAYFEDKNDSQFVIQASQSLSVELASLARMYDSCQNIIIRHYEPFVFNVLSILLDSCRLEIFPSCNLERIRDQAGEEAGEEALTLLDLFNSNANSDGAIGAMARIQQKRRNKADEAWKFSENLGMALVSKREGGGNFRCMLGEIFQNIDVDLIQKPVSFLDSKSLERESLKCLKLLRTIISVSSPSNQAEKSSFERVVSFSISLVITHMLKIVQSLKYQDRIGSRNHDEDSTARRTKTQELLAAYVELLITLVSWVHREDPTDLSVPWKYLQSQLCDLFLFPILRRQPLDLTSSFHQILKASLSVITNNSQAINTTFIIVPGCSQYLDNLLATIMRRSRQLLIASTKTTKNSRIQHYLIDALIARDNECDSQISRNLGIAFSTGNHTKAALSSLTPLQEGIDEYIGVVEEELSSAELVRELTKVKAKIFDVIVLPRLKSRKTDLRIKTELLKFITDIIDLNEQNNADSILLDKPILRSLIKGIHTSLVQGLENLIVDDDVVSAVFSCSATLAKALGLLRDASNQNMFGWSQGILRESIDKDMVDMTSSKVGGVYFWLFFKCLQHMGSLIVDTSEIGLQKLMKFRNSCLCSKTRESDLVLADIDIDQTLLDEDTDFRTLETSFRSAEKILFPLKENNPNIVNVYAKSEKSKIASKEDLTLWVPSAASKKATKEFLAEFLSVS